MTVIIYNPRPSEYLWELRSPGGHRVRATSPTYPTREECLQAACDANGALTLIEQCGTLRKYQVAEREVTVARCWRGECSEGCYYPECCSEVTG